MTDTSELLDPRIVELTDLLAKMGRQPIDETLAMRLYELELMGKQPKANTIDRLVGESAQAGLAYIGFYSKH